MATSEQLKTILKSYMERDDARFYSVAMQIAAHEARAGHGQLARELRELIDTIKAKETRDHLRKTIPIAQPQGELSNLLTVSYPKEKLSDMVLGPDIRGRLDRIIKEQRQMEKIRSFGLSPRRKFLLVGPPGTGKTLTASALAGELHLPLFLIRLEGVITKYMGETAAKLRQVFDALKRHRGIYLFDEFDSIGAMRLATNDVGEIRRILNSFFQFIDEDESQSLILAATNHPEMLDYALFRRFDDVVQFTLPDPMQRKDLLKNRLTAFHKARLNWDQLAEASDNLSHAEITRACEDAVKDVIIHDRDKITEDIVLGMITERRQIVEGEMERSSNQQNGRR
ncbi:MAG: AAA family ATPase [Syntrophales bacterium]